MTIQRGPLFRKLFLIIGLALAGSGAFASEVSNTTKQELFTDFSGGLDTNDPSHKVPNSFSPYMRNVFIDNGMIETVGGYTVLGSTNVLIKVTGIFPFVRENGQTSFIVTDSSVSYDTPDFKSWTFVSSGSNTGGILTWMQVRNKMWGFNGLDPVLTWDATTKVILDGTKGTPSVPKFRYGAYYQDRVWGYGLTGAASDLNFASVITTDSVIIAPDDSRAWPPINLLHVGQGDGQIGTSLWTYQGQLRAGKEQSIYTIYGDNPSNYVPRKEEANVGIVSNDSVRILDGESHFLGQTGVYRNVRRISDIIQPDINMINKGITSIVSNSWETQADFARGQFSTAPVSVFNTTTTSAGFLTLVSDGSKASTFDPSGAMTNLTVGSPSAGFVVMVTTEKFNPNGLYSASSDKVNIGADNFGESPNSTVEFFIKNIRTGDVLKFITQGGSGQTYFYGQGLANFTVTGATSLWTGGDIMNGNLAIALNWPNPGTSLHVTASQDAINASSLFFTPISTGEYISDIATMTSVTAWGNFDSVNNTNGGSINFYYHSSTSLVNITTQTWISISPGIIIGAPTINKFIQWSATMTAISSVTLPNIDNVIIGHIEGQGSDARAFSMDWLNRYWMAVTTGSDYTKRLIYVKSINSNTNPNAWMPVEGIPVDCFAKANNIFYAGSSTAGLVMRLDYGTNFNGAAIPSYYDLPESILGDYFFDKNILKYIIDGKKTAGGTMTVGSSANERAYSNILFSIDGSGRYSHIIEGITQPVKTLRLRLQNNEKDIGLGIYDVDILYEATKVLSNK